MNDISDDDITTEPTEAEDDKDAGGDGTVDTGDEPTEADEDKDAGGAAARDTGDEA